MNLVEGVTWMATFSRERGKGIAGAGNLILGEGSPPSTLKGQKMWNGGRVGIWHSSESHIGRE